MCVCCRNCTATNGSPAGWTDKGPNQVPARTRAFRERKQGIKETGTLTCSK